MSYVCREKGSEYFSLTNGAPEHSDSVAMLNLTVLVKISPESSTLETGSIAADKNDGAEVTRPEQVKILSSTCLVAFTVVGKMKYTSSSLLSTTVFASLQEYPWECSRIGWATRTRSSSALAFTLLRHGVCGYLQLSTVV